MSEERTKWELVGPTQHGKTTLLYGTQRVGGWLVNLELRSTQKAELAK